MKKRDHMDHMDHIGMRDPITNYNGNDNEKLWEYFVEQSKKLITEETKIFDAIMDAGAAARVNVNVKGKFPYRKYIKEEQMERFNERLLFRIFLLKKEIDSKADHNTTQ
jgi:hypothetical protein